MSQWTVETPVDTDTTMYILSTGEYITLSEILTLCNKKWGEDLVLEELSISGESLRTRSYTNDPEDRVNYENFLVVTRHTDVPA